MVSVAKGYVRCSALKMWKKRKEVYAGYMDGVINVYTFNTTMDCLTMSASFKMHHATIHSIHVLNDLKFAISSGFDSSLKIWQPPVEWEKKIVTTLSLIQGIDPTDNLSTIREEAESLEPETLLNKHRITAWGEPKGDRVVESLLQQIK